MPKFLRIFILSVLFVSFFSFFVPQISYAQDIWVKDQEVTFVGRTAARANDFLQWALIGDNYKWITLTTSSGTGVTPITELWLVIRNIVFAVLLLFILGSAFVMIVTRGQNITIMKFVPRFLIVFVLVLMSFALVQFLYQVTDILQGFFLKVPGGTVNIGPKDLLYVGFDYDFYGFRKIGIENDESAFITLLLTKLTAITYFAMTGLLIIRKIILWFFIIVSPVFPVLLFYKPIRNTAKIWVGEFFRWLLYAPLFALFLHGLVKMWKSGGHIPLNFTDPGTGSLYPTAVNITLGGPGKIVSETNSVSNPPDFALYVAALIMLWVVILLPFLLLQIFLDYVNNAAVAENPFVKNIIRQSWFKKATGSPPPIPPSRPPTSPAPFGLSKTLPSFSKKEMQIPTSKVERTTISNVAVTAPGNIQRFSETRDMLRLTNLTIPKMRDIARFESTLISNNLVNKQEANSYSKTLERIATPAAASLPNEVQRFTSLKEKLVSQLQKGDSLAASILDASKITSAINQGNQSVNVALQLSNTLQAIANPQVLATSTDKEKITEIHDKLVSEKEKGSTFASSILATTERISSSTTTEKETLIQNLKETLIAENAKGNQLAGQILSIAGFTQTQGSKVQLTNVIQAIANPQVLATSTDKEKITEIHDKLVSEKEKGSTFASSILATTERISSSTTTEKEKETLIQNLKETLIAENAKGNQLAGQILNTLLISDEKNEDISGQLVKMLVEIASPGTVTTSAYTEKIKDLRETLVKEKEKGDPLATSILDSSQKIVDSSVPQSQKQVIIEQLKEKLIQEREKGSLLASSILPGSKTINSQLTQVLQQIAHPEIVETKSTIERISSLREKLISEKAKGNLLATTVLEAAEKVSSVNVSQKEKDVIVEKLKETLVSEKQRGNALASAILPEEKTIIQSTGVVLPAENKVQQVSIEEYEDVKRMWQENYQNMEAPVGPEGKKVDKHEFIQNDIDNITETINLLSSDDKENVEKGMSRVANILPFLLLGGFSKAEVVSYLKAKLEAAKDVLGGVLGKKDEEETMLERSVKKSSESTNSLQAEIPIDTASLSKPVSPQSTVNSNISTLDKEKEDDKNIPNE